MTLVKWNPARELLSLEKEFSKMFSEMESKFGFNSGKQDTEAYENAVWCPLTDITENKDNYEINLDLPGVEKRGRDRQSFHFSPAVCTYYGKVFPDTWSCPVPGVS